MLDQSFTAKNFHKIFDYENRKGHYLESKFFPEVKKFSEELKKIKNDFKNLKKSKKDLSTDEYEKSKSELNEKKATLIKKKKEQLQTELEKISQTITSGHFRIELNQVNTPIGKPAYCINTSDVSSFFIIKQLQYNIKKLYKVKQSSRYDIICQLRGVLENDFPKYIIRTDIKDFYESIKRDKLFEKLNRDYLLTPSSKKFIKNILREYEKLSSNSVGLPRGVGISAYLSEIYMRDFDQAIKERPEVIYYARYVDDIILVYIPSTELINSGFRDLIEHELAPLDLNINEEKTKLLDLTENKRDNFEYLGYKLILNDGKLELKISQKREQRYKEKIQITFEQYQRAITQGIRNKEAERLLIKRLRFLTGNTRLLNNKDNVMTGIYFSNSLITNSTSLNELDRYLEHKSNNLNQNLISRIEKFSFTEGWENKVFHKFSKKSLQEIHKVWKNVT
jgi:uncharacterized protein (UPF0297 family)